MKLIFIFGEPASGKFTVGKALAARSGISLFHNHLVVDAVAAVFPFGSEAFVKLREQFWMDVFHTAVTMNRSLIFTFAPEASVAPDFPQRVSNMITMAGGQIVFVKLTVNPKEQEERLNNQDRSAFGKLNSPELLRELRESFAACLSSMPPAALTIDTTGTSPHSSAEQIMAAMKS